MSAPFDPSKLDLNIGDSSEDTTGASSNGQTSSQANANNTAETKPKVPAESKTGEAKKDVENDILESISSQSVTETVSTEKTPVTPAPVDDILTNIPETKEAENKGKVETVVSTDEIKSAETTPTTVETPSKTEENNEKTQDIVDIIENDMQAKQEEKTETVTKNASDKKLIDINLTSLEDIATLCDRNDYDYVLIEPEDTQVKVTFKQDNIDREVKYIKFPTYTSILFGVKQKTKMEIDSSNQEQEGKGEFTHGKTKYKLAAKTVPGPNGERIWIKTKKDTSSKNKKQTQKASLSMVLGFLGAILFVGLVLGGAFIAFIVLNAKTVEDVKFFASLGINLNDINNFISQIVTVIFSILLFICTAALSVSLFKFILTKKTFKRKRVIYAISSTLLLFVTFATGSAWMIIDQKIKNLPNWQEQAYGDLKIFDNSLLISEDFTINQALLSETENLIGPVTLQFDLENFQTNQARKGNTINKYIWNFGDEQIETFSPIVTRTFNEKGNYEISVTAQGTDIQGGELEQPISNIPPISISHVISVEETITNNGGKKLAFDATDLENLGKIDWYFKQPKNDKGLSDYPEWEKIDTGYEFFPGKIFFDELFIGVSIINSTQTEPQIDKIIVISPDGESDIGGEIQSDQDLEDELSFEFYVSNPSTGFSNGFIENYKWTIGNKTYSETGNFNQTEKSNSIKHIFSTYGEHEVQVELTDSKGKTETLRKTINIQKRVKLRENLVILDEEEEEIEDVRYENKSYEYFIDSLGVPAKVKFDARYVRPESILYSLTDVSWDIDNDGDIDGKGKSFEYEVPTEGNHTVMAEYTFTHRKNPSDIIKLKEGIFIEGIKKEAILDLQIEKSTNYAPVTVRFDASKSFIKNDDIVKFVYDYGDGVKEERDAINPGHRYGKAGDYTVTLTVIGSTGKTYSLEKKLILLPPPQTVKISTSLKKAPVGQGIDFSSAESEGQIVEYYWNFGDGNISTDANPTHSYGKPGTYTVSLRVDFSNNNSITDEMEIEITDK